MQLRRIPTEKQSAEAAAASAPSAEEGVPPVGTGVESGTATSTAAGGTPEQKGRQAADLEAGSSPSVTTVPPASPGGLESELLLSVQAESEEEFSAWRDVLTEAAAVSTARKRAQLTASVTSWLSTIPIGTLQLAILMNIV